jgi:hypothetical protein
MKFEIGKYYKHTAGHMINPLVEAETTLYGKTLIAEDSQGTLIAVGQDEDSTANYVETTKEEWLSNFR